MSRAGIRQRWIDEVAGLLWAHPHILLKLDECEKIATEIVDEICQV